MAPINWFWTYLKWIEPVVYRPAEVVKWQGGTGGCWGATLTYAMEMRAMLQGYPPRQLSIPYSLYMDGRYDNNGSYVDAVVQDAREGICLESLMPMPAYAGVKTDTQAYTDITWAVLQTAPSAAARADAPNQVLADYEKLVYSGPADMKLKCQNAIAAGYPLFVLDARRGHVMCGVGRDASGLEVVDSRSMNADTYHLNWDQIGGIDGMVRGVYFAGATMGTPPAMLPKPGVIVIKPPPTGNGPMLDEIISIAQAAKAASDVVTPAQKDLLTAAVAALETETGGPPPPGAWKITAPDLKEYDASGTKWRARDWNKGRMALLRNGGYEGIAPTEAYYPGSGAVVYCKRESTWWIKWNGTSYVYMATGEIPPGYQ